MMKTTIRALALLALATVPAQAATVPVAAPLDTVVFGGGCFWGVQAVFQHVNGVVKATSGYMGGTVKNPNYEQVSDGDTGHAEVVRVIYDPSKVSFEKLLDVFFLVAHDPTQLNRQGPDRGTQYRSALFYQNDVQKRATDAYVARLNKARTYKGNVVTQIASAPAFYVAEKYHQDYATLNPNQPYIRIHDAPKIADLKERYPQLWSDKLAAH